MENTLDTQQQSTNTQEIAVVQMNTVDTSDEDSGSINIYPTIRHLFLILCILLTAAIIIFLIYQNGKSIYDQGI
ncbi:hypothetical protein K9M47_01515 [Candidatus Gracilibacteria bacterium]|nr:hypothetical protein [Candidatus Gracilibacteria bacterium]